MNRPNATHQIKPSSRKRPNNKGSISLTKYLRSNAIALIGVLASALGTYAAVAKPAITNLRRTPDNLRISGEQQLGTANTLIKLRFTTPMQNRSFKAGHLANLEIIPESNVHLSNFSILDLDKSEIGWFKTRDCQVQLSILLSAQQAQLLKASNSAVAIKIRYFDNNNSVVTFNNTEEQSYTEIKLL